MVLMQKPSMVDSPSGRTSATAPRWDLADTEGYSGGNISSVAPWMFRGMQAYIGGRSMSVAARGADETGGAPYRGVHPPISWRPRLLLDLHSKSSGSCSFQKSCSRRFIPFGLRLIFLFFEILKQAEKIAIRAGPPVRRLVPKMIQMCKIDPINIQKG